MDDWGVFPTGRVQWLSTPWRGRRRCIARGNPLTNRIYIWKVRQLPWLRFTSSTLRASRVAAHPNTPAISFVPRYPAIFISSRWYRFAFVPLSPFLYYFSFGIITLTTYYFFPFIPDYFFLGVILFFDDCSFSFFRKRKIFRNCYCTITAKDSFQLLQGREERGLSISNGFFFTISIQISN